ncbi:MAG: efflux RND transporter periplasmic adaptor subunit [Planctomycetaceae bacterium]|nr:efflux RND transporter periplasmic adaptor subunit [Planctomycetaceae bacterium]
MSTQAILLTRTRVSRRGWSVVATAILVVATSVVAWVYARDHWIELKPTPGELAPAPTVRRVHALGRLEPRGTILQISAPSGNEGARVEELLVEEGQDVARGDVLAVLDQHDRRQAAVAEARARLLASQAKLDQIRAGAKPGDIAAQAAAVERMHTELAAARKELDRARQLEQKQILTAENLELKQLAFDRGELECRRAQALLDSLREVRDVDIRLQEAEIAAATSSLARAQVDLQSAEVRSPAAGRVLKIHTHPGERIDNLGILQLGDVAHMQAVAEIFEGDVQELRVGLKARVQLDNSGEVFQGTVDQIGLMVARKDVLSNDPVSDTDARVLEVRIALDPKDIPKVERLSNARVEVSIEIPATDSARAGFDEGNHEVKKGVQD